MNRRGFLTGLLSAPAVITTPGLLMPVRAWVEPETITLTVNGLHRDDYAAVFDCSGRSLNEIYGWASHEIRKFETRPVLVMTSPHRVYGGG